MEFYLRLYNMSDKEFSYAIKEHYDESDCGLHAEWDQKMKEIWVVMLNTGGSEDYISDYCSTEQIAKRQLALRKEEQKK